MFESVNELNRRLPRPAMTGDPHYDRHVQDLYVSNGRLLRSEAFACLGRSFVKSLRGLWPRLPAPSHAPHAHRA